MRAILLAALFASTTASAAGRSVIGSKHDLSLTGPGPIKAEKETQVCVFCHVAHTASTTAEFLSNRPDIANTHVPYGSSTSRARGGAPTGASRVCLSCHDGTIAVGETLRRRIPMNAAAPGGRIPPGRRSNLGTDLRKTHPVSVGVQNGRALHGPPPHSAVRLDASGAVQCTSCHDAHSEFGGSPEGMFLREPTEHAQLCLNCHAVSSVSAHLRSTRPMGGKMRTPTSAPGSVGAAGCEACHRSHGADPRGRLLSRDMTEGDDALCVRCHDGAVAQRDVAGDMAKPYSHALRVNGKHDAAEGPDSPTHRLPETSLSADRHVACVDCHDPHEATDRRARAPDATGRLAGAWGIDLAGNRVAPAAYEYEVCFKCHADSMNKPSRIGNPASPPRRQSRDDNLRRVFDPAAPSSHPVAAPARNPDVPSLIAPMGVGSYVYCTDCHASDRGPGAGGSGPAGPHGSIYHFLLERNYTVGERAVESPLAYALCYKCHDRDVLLSDPDKVGPEPGLRTSAFPLHWRHVVKAQSPCSACHTPHGVSSMSGSSQGNAHLIDFDLDVVTPARGGPATYLSNGPRSGSCSLTCHGKTHDAAAYWPAGAAPTPGAAARRRGLVRVPTGM